MVNQQHSFAVQIKQALISLLTTNLGPSGMLSTVKAVGATSYSEVGVYPYVGVDIIKTTEKFVANHRVRITLDIGISISCRSTTLLIDAYNQRDSILDDGIGNGIQPILRQQMYLFLNGLIQKCEITDTIYLSNVSENKSSAPVEFFADALVIWNVSQIILV